MSFVNWWYIAGAIATLAVAVTFGNLWHLPGLGSISVGWGALIGIDIRARKTAANPETLPTDVTVPKPRWMNPVVTVAVSAGLIGVGLAIAVTLATIVGDQRELTAPAAVGAVSRPG